MTILVKEHKIFSLNRNAIEDDGYPVLQKHQSFFEYNIDKSSSLKTVTLGNLEELQSVIIKLKKSNKFDDEINELAYDQITITLNSKILKDIYCNSEPPFVIYKSFASSLQDYDAFLKLINTYFISTRELLHKASFFTDDLLILKIKELLFLLSYVKNYNILSESLRKLYWGKDFEFKSIVEEHILKVNSVQELANQTNMSLSKFKRKFHENYNTTPNRYLINRRVEKVAHLLRSSNEQISTIGYECGFVAPAHLTRVFKAKYDKTPSEYRQEHLN
jgi:AraC-like DNA-binding protein